MQREDIEKKPYVEYDPQIGHRYITDSRLDLIAPDGRKYNVRINSIGLRSDREYEPRKPSGIRRILVFGDSMAAGQYVSNGDHFTTILESNHDGVEIVNCGLEGTGTDQQLLRFIHYSSILEYDAVLLCPYLQNIVRNRALYRLSVDLKTRRWVLTPKPRFSKMEDGSWRWEGRPVPDERPFYEDATSDMLSNTDFGGSAISSGIRSRIKAMLNKILEATYLKGLLYGLHKHEPYPDYTDKQSLGWQTMGALLREFRAIASGRPFIVAPITPITYLKYSMAGSYRDRFREECQYFANLLPYLKKLSKTQQEDCFIPGDSHFSVFGHTQVAKALECQLKHFAML